MDNQGWIKLHRSLLDWQWASDPNVFLVFIRLLLKANHKENTWKGIKIARGQVVTGRHELAKEIGISERNVRTALTKLKSTNELTIKPTNKYSVISINNYNHYQQTDQQEANDRPASDQQVTTNNNDKKEIMKRNKYTSLDSLTENEFEIIASDYRVPISLVRSSYDDLRNYCLSKNRRYSNYFSALRNFTKSNAIKTIKEANNGKHSIDARDL